MLIVIAYVPANTRCWTNVGSLLGKRRRRWSNIKRYDEYSLGNFIIIIIKTHIRD